MSLINEALKKAQERQNPSRPRSATNSEHTHTFHSQKEGKSTKYILIGIVGFIFVLAITIGTALIVYGLLANQPPKAEQVMKKDASSKAQSETTSTNLTNLEKTDPSKTELKRISFEAPLEDSRQEKTEETKQTVAVVKKPTLSISQRILEPEPEEPKIETTTPEPARPNPAIQTYIDALKIRGIMSGVQKVLIFDPSTGSSTAYQKGMQLNTSLGVQLSEINNRSINFVDNEGYTYIKRF